MKTIDDMLWIIVILELTQTLWIIFRDIRLGDWSRNRRKSLLDEIETLKQNNRIAQANCAALFDELETWKRKYFQLKEKDDETP